MAFTVVSYNVLATAYLGQGDYSDVPAEVLTAEWRIGALVRQVIGLDADVLCLQEVEADVFDALRNGAGANGLFGTVRVQGAEQNRPIAGVRWDGAASVRSAAGSFAVGSGFRLETENRRPMTTTTTDTLDG